MTLDVSHDIDSIVEGYLEQAQVREQLAALLCLALRIGVGPKQIVANAATGHYCHGASAATAMARSVGLGGDIMLFESPIWTWWQSATMISQLVRNGCYKC